MEDYRVVPPRNDGCFYDRAVADALANKLVCHREEVRRDDLHLF